MSPGLVYYEIAIAAIAVRQDEAPLLDRRFERPAIIGVLIAIKDRVADRANIGAKPARFLHLVGVGGSGSVMWLAVVVQLPQPEFLLQAAAGFLDRSLRGRDRRRVPAQRQHGTRRRACAVRRLLHSHESSRCTAGH